MAIHHLLYACVVCGREGGIKPADKNEVCERCSAKYTRADGALIRCEPAGAPAETKHPAEWLDLLQSQWPLSEMRIERSSRVILRIAEESEPHYHGGVYLGHIEQFGAPMPGVLTLSRDALGFTPEQGGSITWRLDELTAVQPSSTTLQLKVRRGPVLSFRFPDASPLLWEECVRVAVQALYIAAGRGDIAEYQPRIVCR
jgi:hypothetical protein